MKVTQDVKKLVVLSEPMVVIGTETVVTSIEVIAKMMYDSSVGKSVYVRGYDPNTLATKVIHKTMIPKRLQNS